MEYYFSEWLIVVIIWACIWGIVVQRVIENKGYKENWFWWGFFFEVFALIVALTKPNRNSTEVVIKNTLSRSREMVTKGVFASKVDINSSIHITSWNIQKESEENLVLTIDVLNVSEKIISAVMLSVKGFNSFGDKILVGEYEKFDVIGQDMSIAPGEYGHVQTLLPNSDIRKIDITVKKVCFVDETIEELSESKWVETEQKPLTNKLLSCVARDNENGKYHAIIEKDYWQCVCGFVNTEHNCMLCGMRKEHAIKYTEDNIDATYYQYLKDIELKEKEEAERIETKKRKKEIARKKVKKYSVIGAIILSGCIIACLFVGKQLKIAEENLTIEEIIDSDCAWTIEGSIGNPFERYYFDCDEMAFINVFESSERSQTNEYRMTIIDKKTLRVEGIRAGHEYPAEITIIDKNKLKIRFLEDEKWWLGGESFLNRVD